MVVRGDPCLRLARLVHPALEREVPGEAGAVGVVGGPVALALVSALGARTTLLLAGALPVLAALAGPAARRAPLLPPADRRSVTSTTESTCDLHELRELVTDGLPAGDRGALQVTCTYPTGEQVVENALVEIHDGRIVR